MLRPHNHTERLRARARVKIGSDRRPHYWAGTAVRMKAGGVQTADNKAFRGKRELLGHLVLRGALMDPRC